MDFQKELKRVSEESVFIFISFPGEREEFGIRRVKFQRSCFYNIKIFWNVYCVHEILICLHILLSGIQVLCFGTQPSNIFSVNAK